MKWHESVVANVAIVELTNAKAIESNASIRWIQRCPIERLPDKQ